MINVFMYGCKEKKGAHTHTGGSGTAMLKILKMVHVSISPNVSKSVSEVKVHWNVSDLLYIVIAFLGNQLILCRVYPNQFNFLC